MFETPAESAALKLIDFGGAVKFEDNHHIEGIRGTVTLTTSLLGSLLYTDSLYGS